MEVSGEAQPVARCAVAEAERHRTAERDAVRTAGRDTTLSDFRAADLRRSVAHSEEIGSADLITDSALVPVDSALVPVDSAFVITDSGGDGGSVTESTDLDDMVRQ
ncbi:hypothetical protein ACWDPV_06820 [Gordonia sp. NPDC003504]